jgi:hypothetical protein
LQQITPLRREDISTQYWIEFNQLVAQGELSPEIARTIERDLFDPPVPGETRRLNDRAWQIVLDGRGGGLNRAMLRATEGRD